MYEFLFCIYLKQLDTLIYNALKISTPGYLLIIVGVGLVIVAIVGFCGLAKLSRWIVRLKILMLQILNR